MHLFLQFSVFFKLLVTAGFGLKLKYYWLDFKVKHEEMCKIYNLIM